MTIRMDKMKVAWRAVKWDVEKVLQRVEQMAAV
jgi:hypothetical protein